MDAEAVVLLREIVSLLRDLKGHIVGENDKVAKRKIGLIFCSEFKYLQIYLFQKNIPI